MNAEETAKALETAIRCVEIAEKALKDIANWDWNLHDEYGDPGARAQEALDRMREQD